jgi:hypothetical protein
VWKRAGFWPLAVTAVAITVVTELIGALKIPLGRAEIVLFPFVLAILIGTVLGAQRVRRVPVRTQAMAGAIGTLGFLVFLVALGTSTGPQLGALVHSGGALLLQEVGHLFGSVVFSLPIGVALGLGRSAIGATYSIDREPMIAYVGERFGSGSPEYRGALSTYVVGAIFGAVFVAVLTSLLDSFRIFNPLALALGSGVGSSGMMAAATAVLSDAHHAQAAQIASFGLVGNFISGFIGTYAGIYLAMPLARRLFPVWTRLFRRETAAEPAPEPAPAMAAAEAARTEVPGDSADAALTDAPVGDTRMGLGQAAQVLATLAVLMLAADALDTHAFHPRYLLAMVLFTALAWIAVALNRLVRWVPAVAIASLSIALLTAPFSPFQHGILALADGINPIAFATPVLAYVGLSLGRQLGVLKSGGWKLALVALTVITASFVCATLIAQLVL